MARLGGGVAFPLVLLIGSIALCGVGCGTATAPDPAGPVYDFSVTYRRTAILKAENSDPTEMFLVVDSAKIPLPLTKLDDYTFTSEVKGLRVNSGAGDQPYAVYVIDRKRYESEIILGPYDYGRPHSSGDIFIFKSKLTGEETRLLDVVPNTYLWNLPAKCFPRMARFRIYKGGTFNK
jgi:hypothetical protein